MQSCENSGLHNSSVTTLVFFACYTLSMRLCSAAWRAKQPNFFLNFLSIRQQDPTCRTNLNHEIDLLLSLKQWQINSKNLDNISYGLSRTYFQKYVSRTEFFLISGGQDSCSVAENRPCKHSSLSYLVYIVYGAYHMFPYEVDAMPLPVRNVCFLRSEQIKPLL